VTKETLINLPGIQLFSPASPSRSDQEAHTCVKAKRPGTERGLQRYNNNQNYKVEEDEVGGHVARMGEKRNVYRLLVGKPEGKRPLGRPRCRWMDNIKTF
jgi:hypothetical protein